MTQKRPESASNPSARLDTDRSRRIDLPEAVYCAGKTTQQCHDIVAEFLDGSDDAIVATRTTADQQSALLELEPMLISDHTLAWQQRASTGHAVAVVAAGTSDLPVAEECRLTLEALGHRVDAFTDVGVAGLHRLTAILPELEQSELIVTIAGMEGALATVLAGLVPQPIVSVPTSVGYGTSFEGITALLSMMASCAPGISVVGIDNGYGAACAAHRSVSHRSISDR